MTEPNPDDQVRCTLGDNVLVGKVMGPVTDTHLSLIYGNAKYARLDRATWKVEVLDPEPDNYPTQPGLYEVTWEDGKAAVYSRYEVSADGLYRLTLGDGSRSKWMTPQADHRRATWKRLPDPLPPEPPVGAVVFDGDGDAWTRTTRGWHLGSTEYSQTWAHIQQYGPFTRLVPAPDPDDEQQVAAVADAIASAEASEIRPGYRDMARAALTFLRDGGNDER